MKWASGMHDVFNKRSGARMMFSTRTSATAADRLLLEIYKFISTSPQGRPTGSGSLMRGPVLGTHVRSKHKLATLD